MDRRLAPAVAGFLTVLVVGFTAARLAGPTAGAYAALALAGCVWHVGMSHFVTLDALLAFLLACALCSFLLANRVGLPPGRARLWMLAAWAELALAMLTKGLLALAIPGATLVLYSIFTRDLGPWRRLHVLPGLALFVLIAAPWFVAVSIANPGFAEFFFIHEHVQRFLTTEHRRTGAWWYFVPLFVAGILPWLTIAPWTWRRPGRRPRRQRLSLARSASSGPRSCSCSSRCRDRSCRRTSCPMFAPLMLVLGPRSPKCPRGAS